MSSRGWRNSTTNAWRSLKLARVLAVTGWRGLPCRERSLADNVGEPDLEKIGDALEGINADGHVAGADALDLAKGGSELRRETPIGVGLRANCWPSPVPQQSHVAGDDRLNARGRP